MIKGASIFLCLAVAALLTLGLVMLASASAKWDMKADQYEYLVKQSRWLGVGILVMIGLAFVDYRKLRTIAWPALAVTCVALGCCYLPGIGVEVNGERRWIDLPGLGRFQPSEPAKLFIMVGLATWYARNQAEIGKFWRGYVGPALLLGVPLLLILFEKDMGTSAALGAAGLLVMFVAGTRLRYLVPTVAAAAAGLVLMVQMSPNRMARIMAFMDLDKYREGAAWQQWLALRAFGNGGLEGVGLGNGIVKQMNLPEHHTDFIFPVIGEELGLWYTMGVVFCFVVIFLMGVAISLNASDLFGRILGLGVTSIIVIPAMMNIGVTTASLPNTGLPLPFVSYGGSNLVFTMAMVGVLLSLHRKGMVVDSTALPPTKDKRFELRL